MRIGIMIIVSMTLSSCADSVYNPHLGKAEHIFVAEGSFWGDGGELELSKAGGKSSFFEHSNDPSQPFGIGRRVEIKGGSQDFEFLEESLRLLEIRAFPESRIEKELLGDFAMGFDCKHRVTSHIALFIMWKYPDGEERHAIYDTGCQNSVTKKIRSSYFRYVRELKQGIAADQWFKSVSRYGVDRP